MLISSSRTTIATRMPRSPRTMPRVTGFVRFSPPIEPIGGIDVQVEFLVVNAHETLREFRLARDPASEGREHAGYNTRRVPCERLIRIITRSPELDRAGCEWRASVLRPNGEKDWEEWNSSSLTAQAVPGLGAFLMTVRRPLSGHNYRIEWELPKLSQLEATLRPVHKFEFEQFYAKLSDAAAASAVERALDSTLKDLAAELAKHRGVTNFDAETVMSFMRFDRDKIELTRVTDSVGDRSPWTLVPGNGVQDPGAAPEKTCAALGSRRHERSLLLRAASVSHHRSPLSAFVTGDLSACPGRWQAVPDCRDGPARSSRGTGNCSSWCRARSTTWPCGRRWSSGFPKGWCRPLRSSSASQLTWPPGSRNLLPPNG